MPSARIAITCASSGEADAAEAALRPEIGDEVPGARSRLARSGPRSLVLEVEAQDLGALRAALNSYLRWLATAEAVHRVARGWHGPAAGKA